MNLTSIAPSEAATLARLIDHKVGRVDVVGHNYTFFFMNGDTLTSTLKYDLDVIFLAVLGHENYRGIRSGLGALLQFVASNDVSTASFKVDANIVEIKIQTSLQVSSFLLSRDPDKIATPYTTDEFGIISPTRISSNPPGRALAPLHSSAFQSRARDILENLAFGSWESLLQLPPMMVVTGLTDHCNHTCPFCFRQSDPAYQKSDGDVFTNDNLTNLFLNLAEDGVQSIRLCGEGEDTIHPQYVKLILMARVAGMNLLQITNGTMLSKLGPIMVRCIDFLRVSVNGWTSDQYLQKHGLTSPRSFEKVVSGIRQLTRERELSNVRKPTVCISTVLTPGDCETYSQEDFQRLFEETGADLAILKKDLECSRALGEKQYRLKVHQEDAINLYGNQARTYFNHMDVTKDSYQASFDALYSACRAAYPRAFNDDASAKALHPKDWISKLGLGCILRYIRVELERLEVYNCSGLHDYYGDLKSIAMSEAWVSVGRREGIKNDLKRPHVLCSGCGWGDFFSIMNYYIDEEIKGQPQWENWLVQNKSVETPWNQLK